MSDAADVLVLGGGPAGCAAALRACALGLSVQIIERRATRGGRACNGWIGPAGAGLCESLGLDPARIGAERFAGLRLHTWDIRRHVDVSEPDIWGWVVDRTAFDDALFQAARQAGAVGLAGVAAEQVTLGESLVRLRLGDGREVVGRTLLLADGLHSYAAGAANLTPAGRAPRVPQGLYAEFEVPASAAGLEIVIGSNRAGLIATVTRKGTRARLSLLTRGAQAELRAAFQPLLAAARQAGLLPPGPTPEIQAHPSPAGLALDLDTHVGKRCLLLGDAGGFVSAFSNEGIYPAMMSGVLAADVVARALKAPVPQDELASFGVEWRTRLADYLRMPNTDLSLLVPLVFNNPQMCLRVARAFLHGQAF